MARSPQLLDHLGMPVNLASLRKPVAAPAVGDVVSVWTESVASGLTSRSLAQILSSAARGYPDRFFGLAEDMEERDLHYGSVLATRKMAVTGVEPIVVPASKDAEDMKLADAVRELVTDPVFADDYVADLLDALGKGYALVETIWDRSGKEWRPKGYERRDQRHFVLDQVDGRTLRRKVPGKIDGEDLPPFQFSIHHPKRKSGLSVRGGLARLAAWAFVFKSYTLKDWMAFIEVYGMPLRLGRFGRDASDDDKRVLLRAVRDLSSDAAAIVPQGMDIEFIESKGATGNAVFDGMAGYLDRQISKGVLGQTMTTDDGSSLSQAKIHEGVRIDIARSDGRQIATTANRDLVRPFVDLNFGPRDRYPTVVWPITESEDINILSEVVERSVRMGVQISADEYRERIGFGAPETGAAVLVAAPPASISRPGEPPVDHDAELENEDEAQARFCGHCCGYHTSTAAAQDAHGELDGLVEDALKDWQQDLEPLIAPIRALFERAQSYQQLLAGLEDLEAKLDSGPLADRLAKLMMKARGLGDTGEAN
ncbi:MAG: DUF935 domain-containing protein [Devosia sp.]|nr:DUF935 domain-containing protein [Devosia sp.]